MSLALRCHLRAPLDASRHVLVWAKVMGFKYVSKMARVGGCVRVLLCRK